MATPTDEPFASNETDQPADLPAAAAAPQPEEDVSLDPAVYAKSRLQPWRLSHLMILIAGLAVLLWLGVLLLGSAAIIFMMVSSIFLFAFTILMGTGTSWHGGRPPDRIPCCGCWRSRPSETCRWLLPSQRSPINTAALITGESWTWRLN